MLTLIVTAAGIVGIGAVAAMAVATNSMIGLPSVAVAATAYAAARSDAFGATVCALVLGILAGAPFGSSRGVVLLSLLVVVFATRVARAALPLRRRAAMVAWIVSASVFFDVTFFVSSAVLTPGIPLGGALLRFAPVAALVTGVAAFPLVLVLDRIEPALRARRAKSTLFAR
jgi:hypothetical protein